MYPRVKRTVQTHGCSAKFRVIQRFQRLRAATAQSHLGSLVTMSVIKREKMGRWHFDGSQSL